MSATLRKITPLLPAGFRLLAVWLGLLVSGCSPHKDNAPPVGQVRDALSAALPLYLAVAEVETEAIPTATDQVKINCKVTITPKETLYLLDRRIPGDPSILLIKPVQVAGSKSTLYGFVLAQRTLDRWTLTAPAFPDGFEQLGQPRSTFGPQSFVANSAEATAAIKALNDHADELEREMHARDEKERQARQAEAERKQREEQAAKDQIQRATAPGTRYLGTLTDPTTTRSQRLRLTFTEQQGTLLRAEVVNPDRPTDHRPLSGEWTLKRADASSDAADETTAYPIQLTAAAESKQETINGRWGLYWGGSGPIRLRPTNQGGLEGEAIVFQRFVVRLQREL